MPTDSSGMTGTGYHTTNQNNLRISYRLDNQEAEFQLDTLNQHIISTLMAAHQAKEQQNMETSVKGFKV